MCAACGVPGHVPGTGPPSAAPPATQATGSAQPAQPRVARFAALRTKDARWYLGGTMLSMMADNIEHVITYWVLWEEFHSSALAGFAVISHWAPFLLFSFWFGGLADRFDCRRVIQLGQYLFMAVSVGWGVLFLTGTLEIWHACVLLVVHGIAGALWGPAEQLMLHDFVGPQELPSAIRLNATARSLGILFGPVVGGVLLVGLGPTWGIFANVLIYVPLTVFLFRTRFTGHLRSGAPERVRMSVLDAVRVTREVAGNPTLVSMIAVAGLGSFFIGVALQSAMPIFALDLATGDPDGAYGVMLFVHGAGGVLGGLLLEVVGRINPTVRAAVISTLVYGLAMLGFAVTGWYGLSLALLFIGGLASLASMSITQTIVQILAPPDKRGRVLGLYGMSANGLRTGSGFTVGLLGGLIGIHTSLAASAVALCVGTLLVAVYVLRTLGRSGAAAFPQAPPDVPLARGHPTAH
jgi:MFS family permease